jgi:hypothetical protein
VVKLGAEKQRGRWGLFVDAVRHLKRQRINGTEEGKELLRAEVSRVDFGQRKKMPRWPDSSGPPVSER